MKTAIINFVKKAIAPNSLLHGVWVAFIVALGGVIMPMLQSGVLPTQVQLIDAARIAGIAAIGYLLKNGIFGNSVKLTDDVQPK